MRDWTRDALVASGAGETERSRAVSMQRAEPFASLNMTRLSDLVGLD